MMGSLFPCEGTRQPSLDPLLPFGLWIDSLNDVDGKGSHANCKLSKNLVLILQYLISLIFPVYDLFSQV